MPITVGTRYNIEHTLWGLVDLVYPPNCAGCGKTGTQWCADCSSKVLPLYGRLCRKCGDPLPHTGSAKKDLCVECLHTEPAYNTLRSYTLFEGPARKAMHRLKYGGDHGLGFALAWDFATFVDTLGLSPDIVTAVPLSPSRLKQRGYNQAVSLARPLAMLMGWKFEPGCIYRHRETRSQVGLGVWERRENVRDAFSSVEELVTEKKVLLVDDTTTTGSTLDFASCSIIKAGANIVDCIAFAKAEAHQDHPI